MISRHRAARWVVMGIMLLLIPGSGQAESSFYDRLTSSDPSVRRQAVEDFRRFPPEVKERLLPDVMVASRDENPEVQSAATALVREAQTSKRSHGVDFPPDLKKESATGQSRKRGDDFKEIQGAKQEAFPDMKAALDEEKKAQGGFDPANLKSDRELALPSPLLESLKDPDPLVRSRAARGLSQIHPIPLESIEPLTALLKDKSSDVRAAAAGTLGSIGPAAQSAVPALLRTLADGDPGVRQITADALKQIQAPQ